VPALPDDDFVVLAVDLEESRGAVEGFIDEFGLTFPVVLDSSASIAEQYGIVGLPDSFFIDREGIVREVILGPVFGSLLDEGIEAADTAGAAAEDGGT
jgi:peroxiredoxin